MALQVYTMCIIMLCESRKTLIGSFPTELTRVVVIRFVGFLNILKKFKSRFSLFGVTIINFCIIYVSWVPSHYMLLGGPSIALHSTLTLIGQLMSQIYKHPLLMFWLWLCSAHLCSIKLLCLKSSSTRTVPNSYNICLN